MPFSLLEEVDENVADTCPNLELRKQLRMEAAPVGRFALGSRVDLRVGYAKERAVVDINDLLLSNPIALSRLFINKKK